MPEQIIPETFDPHQTICVGCDAPIQIGKLCDTCAATMRIQTMVGSSGAIGNARTPYHIEFEGGSNTIKLMGDFTAQMLRDIADQIDAWRG